MRKLTCIAATLVYVCIFTAFTHAQNAEKPVKPALNPSQAVLEQWNDIGRKLIAMAEDFPEDKYQFKPQEDSRTFVANIMHAAASMYYFTDSANGKKPRYADDPKDVKVTNRAELAAFV